MRLHSMSAGLPAMALVFSVIAPSAWAACSNSNAIGVSRTIKIDTAGGPRYGQLQYRKRQLLKDKEVVLTFDDGPSTRNTEAVLDALSAHCTKATFFMVGRMAVAYPHMVRKVAAAGHTIAAHTWSHRNLKAYSPQRSAGEIELGVSAVSKALGKPIAPFFRFPYLAASKSIEDYLQTRDISAFSIDVDSYDFRTRSGGKMRRTVMQQLASKGKGIILMHDIQQSTASGIAGLLNDLKAGGYKIVHIVPDKPITTLASYDATATELHEKRRIRVSATPLEGGPAGWGSRRTTPAAAAKSKPRTVTTRREPAGPPARRARVERPAPVARPAPRPQVTSAANSNSGMPAWQRQALGLN